jgi:hypothetical protein
MAYATNAYDKRLVLKALREKAARYKNPNWRLVAENLIDEIEREEVFIVNCRPCPICQGTGCSSCLRESTSPLFERI